MRRILYLLFMLSLITVMLFFSACGGDPIEGTGISANTTQAESTGATEDTAHVNVYVDETVLSSGKSAYTIVYPQKASQTITAAIDALCVKISSAYAIEIKVGTDAEISPGAFEILVGKTNREASSRAARWIGLDEYAVKRIDNHITVLGFDDEKTLEAIAGLSALLDGSDLVVSPDQVLLEMRIPHAVSSIQINGVDLREYVIAYGPKTGKVDYSTCAEVLNNRLVNLFGYTLEKLPAEKATNSPYVIAVGHSSLFPETVKPEKNSCLIGAKGNVIYLDGITVHDVKTAIKIFADKYFPSDASGKLSVSISDFEKTEEVEPLGRVRLLTIGNSWSNDAVEHLYNVLHDVGYTDILLGNLYKGNCTVGEHLKLAQSGEKAYSFYYNMEGEWKGTPKVGLNYSIKFTQWDMISLQQNSAGGVDSFYAPLDDLYGYVEENANRSENAVFVWHTPWALRTGALRQEFSYYDRDPVKNYNMIIDATQKHILSTDKFAYVIPSVTVMQNLRESYIGEDVFRDEGHASHGIGRYALSISFYVTLFNGDPDMVTWYPVGLEPEAGPRERAAIREAVRNADKAPMEITAPSEWLLPTE